MLKKSLSVLVSAVLAVGSLAVFAPAATATPSWVDFDASVNAPYVGLENQGSAPIFALDISDMHSIQGKYWFFRGPDLFSFDPSLAVAPTAVVTTPARSAGNSTTGVKNKTFASGNLILYTGDSSGVWAHNTSSNASIEIKAGANSLRHMRDLTLFNGTAIFIAQVEGSAQGTGWGIYSVDLSAAAATTPPTYAATLRRATSFSVNAWSGFSGFAVHGNLVFYADDFSGDGGSVWVMDNAWQSEALVDLGAGVNTQAGHMVASNNRLGFKARTSNDSVNASQYFILDISAITPATVDGVSSVIALGNPLLTRLTLLNASPLDVQQAALIGNRYIVLTTQNDNFAAFSYDTQTAAYIRIASRVNRAPIRPFTVAGVEVALLAQGAQIRSYNPANGEFGVQVADIGSLVANGQTAYEFSIADTNGDGNSDIAAFGVSNFNQPQRWFHAPVAAFVANAAIKTVTFQANSGSGTMADQTSLVSANLNTNAFNRNGFVFSGWNSLANGTGTAYADAASYPFATDVTLFAQWIAAPTVTFNRNLGLGSMANQSALAATALTTNTFTRAGFNFTGWNTLADGSGTAYANSASFPFAASTTLFAQWAASFTVTFDANQGVGTMNSQIAHAATPLTVNTFTRTGFNFTGWNTLADGSGTGYADVASFPFAASTTLFAQWSAAVANAESYSGPVLSGFSSRTVDTCAPTTITVTGTNLSGLSAKLSGVSVKVLENTATRLVMQVPAGLTAARNVDLLVTSSSGILTVQDAFEIRAGVCSLNISEGLWTKKMNADSIKFYAKSPIGQGKVQFFANGREIAWINAVDEVDPKLTFASGFPYLVRSFSLASGKNRVEIRLDGIRIWRATYAKR